MKARSSILKPSIILLACSFLISQLSASSSSKFEVLPSVRFNVHCTSDSIELQNLVFPSNSILNFFLSGMELIGVDKDVIIQRVLNTKGDYNGRSILSNNFKDPFIKFSNLKGSQTYYLYYVLIIEPGQKVGPFLEIVKTNHPFILSTLLLELNPFGLTPVLIPFVLLVLSIACIKKLEEKCVKEDKKKTRIEHKKEPNLRLHSLRPELKFPLQGTFSQETIIRAKERSLKPLQDAQNLSTIQEKNEIDRVIRDLEEENKEFEDRLMCEICCEKFREVIFLSCGHVYSCEKCAMELVTCPIDKSVICSKYRYTMCDKYGIDHQLLPQIIASKLQSLGILKFSYHSVEPKKEPTQMEKYLGLKVKNENYKMFYNCIICGERKKNILFMHCRHLICCHVCAESLKACPLDGVNILKKTHVFTA